MRKYQVYMIALALFFLLVWFCYDLSLKSRSGEYRYGTFVELPEKIREERELRA